MKYGKGIATVALSGGLVLGASGVGTPAAYAGSSSTTTCSTDANGVETCVTEISGSATTPVDHESNHVTTYSHGQVHVVYLISEHLVTQAQMHQAEKNGSCRWYKRIWNSGFVNGTGAMGWKLDHHVYACWIHGKLYKEGGGITGAACENLERPFKSTPPAAKIYANAIFANHMTYKATATAESTSTAHSFVKVSVHNVDYSCVAVAKAHGSGKGKGKSHAAGIAHTKSKAVDKAQGKLQKKLEKTNINSKAVTHAQASAKSHAVSQASASATCTSSSPPPSTCSHGGTPPNCFGNLVLSLAAEACVSQGQTGSATLAVNVSNDASDSVAVEYSGPSMVPDTLVAITNGSGSAVVNGFSPGTYTAVGTLKSNGETASTTFTVNQCSTPPPSHSVTVSCTGPEEITQGDTVTIPCTVADNDNDLIGLQVTTDGNSNATSIVCTTNGSGMCPSGGKFEFLLKGINTPSTTVNIVAYTVDAQSSVDRMVFDVDPASSGF